jgi:hypothetical protein
VGNFALEETGEFVIAGLRPGTHVLRVEPLDDAEIESFFDRPALDVEFQPTFYERLVVVPRGGGTQAIEIPVRAR